ncbi:MAG: hypothetical protein JW795_17105 [Chitinivibrionales bacterium]|nr:hypothetical protein [Chitinivibrionales bacterium]
MIDIMSASYSIASKADAKKCTRSFIAMVTELVRSDHPEININDTNVTLRDGIANTVEAVVVIKAKPYTSFFTITASVRCPIITYKIIPTGSNLDDISIEEVF